ncbi:hypothetical protein [Deinococcus detaillensis]|uniref:hypothetical protein n=1 Tax=Deinococcus detaillensis TaxID=2592048 RepID=UPI00163DBA9F|nr:hypothetical protein [Deinococcus detaillensis]
MGVSLLLTACSGGGGSGGGGGGGSGDQGQPKIGLGVGVTNTVSCQAANGLTRTAPATAITLALRDKTGTPVAPNANHTVTLNLKTPDGSTYTFKNPYNPDTEDNKTFQASENYFILCAAPLSGNYEISGNIDGQGVSDNQPLVAVTPPQSLGNSTLKVQSLNAAEAQFTAPADTQAAIVNYYRGNQNDSGIYSGYRVGFGSKSASPEVTISQTPPEKPKKTCDEDCQDRAREKAQQVPDKTIPGTPPPDDGGGSSNVVFGPPIQFRGGLMWASGAVFGKNTTADKSAGPGLRTQALSGAQSIALTLPAGHMRGEPYYAEIITSDKLLGATTAPESLGRVDLKVVYTPVVTPIDADTTEWQARLSAAPMTVKNQAEKAYQSLTTSLMTKDGFPSVRTWSVKVRGPGNALIWEYNYPAFTPYVLTAAPIYPDQQIAGNYTADFTAPGVGVRTQTFAVASALPLPVPNDATLRLKPDLSGFTFTAPSGPRSHWVYVTESGKEGLVAARTCVVNAGQTCNIDKKVTLAADKRYMFTLISTEAPLDLNPLLSGTDWNFAQPIRWAIQYKDAASNPIVVTPVDTSDLLVADASDLTNISVEASKPVQFGTFDAKTKTPLNLPGINWTIPSPSRPGIVSVDASTGLVKSSGKDLGRFKIVAAANSRTGTSIEFSVFGLVCAGGQSSGGAALLCKFRDAQGKIFTNLPYTVQAPGWNNDQPFLVNEEVMGGNQGALAFDKFNGILLPGAATYNFEVKAGGKTFRDTASIDANGAAMDAPTPTLQSEGGQNYLTLNLNTAPDTKSARIELKCAQACTDTYMPVIVQAQGGASVVTLPSFALPSSSGGDFGTPKLQYTVTTYNVDLTQPDPDLPDQFKSATGGNFFFICSDNRIRSSCGDPRSR